MRLTSMFAVSVISIVAPLAAAPTTGIGIDRLDPALDGLIAPDAQPERVATGFSFTEGPMWKDGRLWFSDVNGDKMRAVDPAGKVQELIANSGGLANPPAGASIGSNAMVPAEDGSVLMAQMGARRIVRIDGKLNIHPFLAEFQGKRLNSPNDLVYARDGALWFTDPPFGLFNGMDKDPAKQLPFNGVFRYAQGVLKPVITDLKLPNGIGFSPDGHVLYVTDYGPPGAIFAYDVGRDGALSNKRTLIAFPRGGGGGADGLKVDRAGNIWATGPGGIRIITPQGKVLGQIRLPEVAANLAFAGDGHILYITASTSIYRLRTKVAGVLPRYTR
ncbi:MULTISPECIES: SMP-30/gluconolactonase/LRE family protein [unclassified Sphingomonas]|uniref:SMP-30/gluconolactonase/LRE family protein n=1 Tax=unclassified Sphingomonas TaxID=196159 RepID=UPI00092A773A|nr:MULTISPECIES: SMP-30/gluconolactonase/LRE family protein [unclassified Sphingomonas]OJU17995.1 MAG: gluconolactonase [Sphingomonas sp. 66-10]